MTDLRALLVKSTAPPSPAEARWFARRWFDRATRAEREAMRDLIAELGCDVEREEQISMFEQEKPK